MALLFGMPEYELLKIQVISAMRFALFSFPVLLGHHAFTFVDLHAHPLPRSPNNAHTREKRLQPTRTRSQKFWLDIR